MERTYLENYGLMIPKYVSYKIKGIWLTNHPMKEYKEFEEWLSTGSFKQCQCDGNDVNIWMGKFYFDMGIIFLSLQELLEAWIEWRKPKTFGFTSYTFNIKP